ncbi:MAG: hypothetical protein IKJ01_04470 [Lachnospiraceae bacterium]|nr:hypothetical protein [Lachnospiraceae bacterium]
MSSEDIEKLLLKEVKRLEHENTLLRKMFQDERKAHEKQKIEEKKAISESCQRCKKYVQYYTKSGEEYTPIYAGHCMADVPVKKGGKRRPKPDEVCQYFENMMKY